MVRTALSVSAAVGAILAANVASAACGAGGCDIYISGASAQRNFWRADLAVIANCSGIKTFTWDGPATAPFSKPDLSFTTCTAGSAPLSPIVAGTTVTIHYTAELGSVSGVTMALGKAGFAGYPTQQVFLQNGANCCATTLKCDTGNTTAKFALYTPAAQSCPEVGNITFCGTGTPSNLVDIITTTPDIDSMDVEPTKWSNPDNWPNILKTVDSGDFPDANEFNKYGAAPTLAQLQSVQSAPGTGGGILNGQLFAIAVNGVPGGDPVNLSHASLQSIFQTGAYTTWAEVPEVGPSKDTTGTPIIICRRDNGSGTQTSVSMFTTGTECALPNTGAFQETNGTSVLINAATSSLKACVNAHTGSIGFFSLTGNLPGSTDLFKIETIDGVEANAHNAAAGYYPFAFETFGVNHSGSAIATLLLNRAKSQSNLQTQLGSETVTVNTNHQFHVSSGNPVGVWAIPGIGSPANPNTMAALTASPALPVGLGSRGGESCTLAGASN